MLRNHSKPHFFAIYPLFFVLRRLPIGTTPRCLLLAAILSPSARLFPASKILGIYADYQSASGSLFGCLVGVLRKKVIFFALFFEIYRFWQFKAVILPPDLKVKCHKLHFLFAYIKIFSYLCTRFGCIKRTGLEPVTICDQL